MNKEFVKVMISHIREMEEQKKDDTRKFYDIIDRQKESIVSYIEQNKIKDDWAIEFLKRMEIGL